MASQQLSTNTFGVAKWIVSASASLGTHTTIGAAITSASAGDTIWIREGTYTENLTLKAGVNLATYAQAFAGVNNVTNGGVIIKGNATMSTAGQVTITGIQFQTNAAAVLTVSGSAASVVYLHNCDIEANTTAIQFSSSVAASTILLNNCNIDLLTTGIAAYSSSSAGLINFVNSTIGNIGNSTTSSSNSAGNVYFYYTNVLAPLSTSSTGNLLTNYSTIDASVVNTTPVTTAGTGFYQDIHGSLRGGTASALVIGAGTTALINDTVFSSSNANQITGAGTLTYTNLALNAGSAGLNPTTRTPFTGYIIDATNLTLSGDANTATVNISSGAAAKNTNIGNTTSTSTLALKTGTNTTTPVYTVATNSGTIISALGAGSINYPLQPAFQYLLETPVTNATGNAGVYTLGSGTALIKIFDQGNNMTTGGVFTAPVAGNYLFTFTAQIINCTIGTFMNLRIVTTKRNYYTGLQRAASSANFYIHLSVIANMSAADTATFTLIGTGEAGNTQTINGSGASTGDQFTYVTGQLLS